MAALACISDIFSTFVGHYSNEKQDIHFVKQQHKRFNMEMQSFCPAAMIWLHLHNVAYAQYTQHTIQAHNTEIVDWHFLLFLSNILIDG